MPAAVVALLADEKKDAAEFLGLRFETGNGVADGIEDGGAAIAGLQVFELAVDRVAGVGEVLDELRPGVKADERDAAARIGKKKIEEETENW